MPNDLPVLDHEANQGGHLERGPHGAQLVLHQQVDVNLRERNAIIVFWPKSKVA